MRTVKRLPLDVFLHCTLGGFAEEQPRRSRGPRERFTEEDKRVIVRFFGRNCIRGGMRHGGWVDLAAILNRDPKVLRVSAYTMRKRGTIMDYVKAHA